jgi:hypothetical protein
MVSRSRAYLAILFAALSFMLLPACALAQSTYDYSVYVDSDANPATGCNEGPVSGAEVRLHVTANGGLNPQVVQVARARCSGATFGAESTIAGNYAVGVDNGVAGSDVIELSDSLSQLASAGSPSLVFSIVATSARGQDSLLTSNGAPDGSPIALGLEILPIPLLGIPALVLMILLVGLVGARMARRRTLWRVVALLSLISGVALAANFVVDGQVGDWSGVSPLATDPAGDATSGESAIDLRAFFAAIENGRVFMRVDVSNLQSEAPIITSGASTTFAVGAPGSFEVTATGVPVPTLSQVCAPALPAGVTFTDNGDGTGTLAGTPPIGSVGSYACTITASNGTPPDATQNFTLTIDPSASNTALTSSPNPSVFGQSVTLTATVTVTAPATGTPTGSVTFFDGATSLGSGTLDGSGVATFSSASLGVAGHPLSATYSGDADFETSTSATVNQVVNAAATATALVSDANPSSFGQNVTFSATVTASAPGVGTPTGSVAFFDGVTNIGSGTLDGSGVATLATGSLSVATHAITAQYAGDGSFATSTSSAVNQVVNQGATSTALVSATNPSVFGQSVTLTATVSATAPASGTPAGSVDFLDGVTTIGTGTLDGAGVATLSTSSLSVATHPITAHYIGNASYATSTSGAVSQVVNQGATSTALVSATNPSVFGESVTLTATVSATAPATGTPAGNVDFLDGATSIGTGTLDGAGVATLSTSSLAVATHPITAHYIGNASYAASTSGAVSQVVNPGATSTALVLNDNPALVGASVSFTATVSATAPATGTPTGSVDFFDGASNIGTQPLAGGQATLATTALTPGTHAITATYTGTANFTTSTSAASTQTINQAPTITSAASEVFPPGVAHSFTVTTTGFPTGASMLISQTGALPTGLSFVNNNDGTATLSGTPSGSGNFPIVITANNGIAPNATQNFTISLESAPIITSANSATFTVGLPNSFTVTTSGSPTVTAITLGGAALPSGVSYLDNGDGTATLSGTPAAGTAGPYLVTFTATNGVLPDAVQNPFTLTVVQQSQTISYTSAAPAATVDGPTYAVTATATSGLPVAFTIDASASAVCTIAGSTVSFIGVGTCVIDANQAGDGTFSAAPQVQQSFAVGQGSQTISFTSTAPAAAVFGGPTYTVIATATSGLPVTFAIDASASSVCSIAGSTVSFIGVGTCVVNANQAGNANYLAAAQVQQSFAVAKADQTISFTSSPPATPAVGGATYTVAATSTSGLPVAVTIDASASAVCTIAGTTVSFIGSGSCVINANQAGNANYNAAPQVQQSFAVKQSQTISFTSAAPTNATVGGATYTVTASATSGLPVAFTIDSSASAVCTIAGATVSFIGSGSCVINADQPGDANYYAAPQVQQTFVVRTAQTITFTSIAPNPGLYQGPTYTVTANGGGSGNPVTFTIDASAASVCTIAGSTVSFIGTGLCVIDANQAGNASYEAAPQVQQSFGVAPNPGNDTYTALGNVLVDSSTGPGTPFTTASNDNFPAGTTISTFDAVSTNGGSVTMTTSGANIGRFTYDPPVGYTGSDTFTYTLSSNGQTRSATVTVTITGKAWFINNNPGACSSSCDGRLSHPYVSTASFQLDNTGAALKPAANDTIFVHGGGGSYSGSITLLNGQRLIGQAASASLSTLGGVTAQSGQILPATGGTSPVLTSAGIVVTVGSGNFIHGLTLGNGTTALSGTAFGTLTINDNVTIASNGQAINLTNGTLTATLNSVTSSGGVNNINLVQVAGTSNLGTGALSGATGTSFAMGTGAASSGGTATITYGGSITQATSGQAPIVVQNRTGGTLTLSGAVTASAAGVRGISLLNNTGATTAFSGPLQLSTGTNPAFTATGGGTVTASDTTSTLATTTATAVVVGGTTIGAAGLNFRSITAGTGASGPVNGIVLNTTGVIGGLTVNGTGAVGSGGTIQRTTGDGISLVNTMSPSFTNMIIQNTAGDGIAGTQVVNFSFVNGSIDNSGTGLGAESANIAFNTTSAGTENNLSGVVTIAGNSLTNSFYHGVDIFNFNGTISNATILGNTITSSTSTASSLGSGIRLIAFGSATTVANVTKATIANNVVLNFPSGSGIQAQGGNANAAGAAGIFGTAGSATDVIAITGNRVSGASPAVLMGAQAILGAVNGKGQGNFDISSNGTVASPIGNTIGTTLALSSFGSANVTATINNNVIVSNNKFASQGIGAGTGITFAPSDAPTLAMTISGNNISQTDGNGILVVARDATGTVRAKIQNNTVAAPLAGNRNGIRIDSGNGASANESVCLNISSNISAGTGLTPEGIGIRKQGAIAGVNNMAFHGLATSPATAAQALAYIASQNPGSVSGAFLVSGDNFNSPTCNLP